MLKKIIIVFCIAFVMMLFSGYTSQRSCYDRYPSAAKIFYNNNEILFNDTVFVINDKTYVPLREVAEKSQLNVGWIGGDEEKIVLTEKSPYRDAINIINKIGGSSVITTSELLNLNYLVEDGEIYIDAKVLLSQEDLQTFQELKKTMPVDQSIIDEYGNSFVSVMLRQNSQKYEWWNLSDMNDCSYFYKDWKTGNSVKTVQVCGLVVKETDNHYLYLYQH